MLVARALGPIRQMRKRLLAPATLVRSLAFIRLNRNSALVWRSPNGKAGDLILEQALLRKADCVTATGSDETLVKFAVICRRTCAFLAMAIASVSVTSRHEKSFRVTRKKIAARVAADVVALGPTRLPFTALVLRRAERRGFAGIFAENAGG